MDFAGDDSVGVGFDFTFSECPFLLDFVGDVFVTLVDSLACPTVLSMSTFLPLLNFCFDGDDFAIVSFFSCFADDVVGFSFADVLLLLLYSVDSICELP